MTFKISPDIDNDKLNELFSESWKKYTPRSFEYLNKSLLYICCYEENDLIGFVNIISDGYLHAFLLDVTVSPKYRRKGIGTLLVKRAIEECKEIGIEWIHVDFEERLGEFYHNCRFKNTNAGIMNLKN